MDKGIDKSVVKYLELIKEIYKRELIYYVMSRMNLRHKIGDNVVVKQGVMEPDLEEFEIGGWQGRVVEIDASSDLENTLITIEWDSFTLKRIPAEYIEQSEEDGYDWQNMTLYDSDLEKTNPKDDMENVRRTQEELSNEYYWTSFGEAGKRISKILGKVNPEDEMECLQAWVEHLDQELTFPVEAIAMDSEANVYIKQGNKMKIIAMSHFEEMYGIIASVRIGRKKYGYPLCVMEVADNTSSNFQPIEDYRTWFANR